MGAFKEPHGGVLKELFLGESAADEEAVTARDYKSWNITERQHCDLELLLNGSFSPLEGFLKRQDYESVLKDMRLASGLLWPIPINLDVSQAFAEQLASGEVIALRDREGVVLATMEVEEIWEPDRAAEAAAVFGTENEAHPGVAYLLHEANPVYLGGRLRGLSRRATTTSSSCGIHPRNCAAVSGSWGGARWWPTKPAIPCTVPIRS